MIFSLMFTASVSVISRCRPLRKEVMEMVSHAMGEKTFGKSINLILVDVVIQDGKQYDVNVRFSKKRDVTITVPLGRKWVLEATDNEIKEALVDCMIIAVNAMAGNLKRGSDFLSAELLKELMVVKAGLKDETSHLVTYFFYDQNTGEGIDSCFARPITLEDALEKISRFEFGSGSFLGFKRDEQVLQFAWDHDAFILADIPLEDGGGSWQLIVLRAAAIDMVERFFAEDVSEVFDFTFIKWE